MITGFAILGIITAGLLLLAAVCYIIMFLSELLTHKNRISRLETRFYRLDIDRLNEQVQNHAIDHLQSNIKGKKK